MPYTALQQMLDEANAWGMYGYEKGAYIAGLTDDVIDVVTEQVPRKTSPLSVMLLYQLDGATPRPARTTRRSRGPHPAVRRLHRRGRPGPEMLPADRAWVAGVLGRAAPAHHRRHGATSTR